MELVHGEPITDYCDRHKLTLEERLELFITVCQAVQHAHQKGIIHRDLKPTNVLVAVVDDQPVPKIIDFGVAKAMAQPLTQQTIFTEQGQLIGTPEYMSPEQAEMSNLDIDTRSDIYSLGVLLYELLTGALPFDRQTLRQAGFEEIRRIIREVEPPKPSTKISTLGEDSQKPCRKSPHGSAKPPPAVAAGTRLDRDEDAGEGPHAALCRPRSAWPKTSSIIWPHEPVQAGPPGSWYRIRRYARRYRMPLCDCRGICRDAGGDHRSGGSGYYREAKRAAATRKLHAVKPRRRQRGPKHNFKMAGDAVKKYYTQVALDPRLKPHNLEGLRRDFWSRQTSSMKN